MRSEFMSITTATFTDIGFIAYERRMDQMEERMDAARIKPTPPPKVEKAVEILENKFPSPIQGPPVPTTPSVPLALIAQASRSRYGRYTGHWWQHIF